ncbi:diguanylate cyclase domain-containing protein [Leucobacter chromiireducens]|uniref:diguanylate cyclase domain-containing protein n=1 Tax=Leucobacter chromiireducens TaxID=283877 RepID=UPI000F62C4C4|nr:diguanylate cyclase [Leucobacter chromiireducens]
MTAEPLDTSGRAAPPTPAAETAHDLLRESPVALLAVDTNGQVLAHNDALRRWVGGPDDPERLEGRNLVEWLTPAARLFYESRVLPQLFETGCVREIMLELRASDGSARPTLCTADLRTTAAGRRVVHIAAFDATERIAFERELVAARREAELAQERLDVLHGATSALAVAAGLDDLGEALVRAATRATNAGWVRVTLVDHERTGAGGALRSWGSAPPAEPELSAVQELPDPDQLVCHDAAELRALGSEEAARLAGAGVEALVVTPIVRESTADHPVFGEIRCWFRRPRALDAHELDTLQSVAAQAERVLEHLQLQAQLRHRALHDGLTGLPNRVLFAERLEQLLATAARTGEACAVLFIDLDGFKAINDGAGHAAGDEVLRAVAARLRASCRAGDTVSRLGGDEFVVAVSGATNAAVTALAERIRTAVRMPLDTVVRGAALSSSVGVARWEPTSTGRAPTVDGLMHAADAAMYAAKNRGKDAVIVREWGERGELAEG